jgi:hypothetical protein
MEDIGVREEGRLIEREGVEWIKQKTKGEQGQMTKNVDQWDEGGGEEKRR